MESITKNYTFC